MDIHNIFIIEITAKKFALQCTHIILKQIYVQKNNGLNLNRVIIIIHYIIFVKQYLSCSLNTFHHLLQSSVKSLRSHKILTPVIETTVCRRSVFNIYVCAYYSQGM